MIRKSILALALFAGLGIAAPTEANDLTLHLVTGTNYGTLTSVTNSSRDSISIWTPGNKTCYYAEAKPARAPIYGSYDIGTVAVTNNGKPPGGGGGGHNQYGPDQMPGQMGGSELPQGIVFHFYDNIQGITADRIMVMPGFTGTINLTGNAVEGFKVTSGTVFSVPMTPSTTHITSQPTWSIWDYTKFAQ